VPRGSGPAVLRCSVPQPGPAVLPCRGARLRLFPFLHVRHRLRRRPRRRVAGREGCLHGLVDIHGRSGLRRIGRSSGIGHMPILARAPGRCELSGQEVGGEESRDLCALRALCVLRVPALRVPTGPRLPPAARRPGQAARDASRATRAAARSRAASAARTRRRPATRRACSQGRASRWPSRTG